MENHRHFILYKPYGYLSQFINNQSRRKNKRLLGELHNYPAGTMAIERLDQDSEGLLLLTTDGKVSEQIRSHHVEKEYYLQLDGEVTDQAINQLRNGIEITVNKQKYKTLKCKANRLISTPVLPERSKKIRDERHGPTSWLSVTITEGKFRQVRKMTAAVGFPTLRLIRVRIGNIKLDTQNAGESKEVEYFDI